MEELAPASGKAEIKLTDRELQILNLIAKGSTNKQIADKIFLSPETIKWYRKKLLTKFNASSASALISEAYKNGFLKK